MPPPRHRHTICHVDTLLPLLSMPLIAACWRYATLYFRRFCRRHAAIVCPLSSPLRYAAMLLMPDTLLTRFRSRRCRFRRTPAALRLFSS